MIAKQGKTNPSRWLPIAVMGYMALAIGWWSILLYRTLTDNFNLQMEKVPNDRAADLIEEAYQRELFMIIGEGMVFILILGIGLYLINKSYFKELEIALQKRNFLLSVSHELKSPIAGIKLALQTLQKRKLDDKHKDQLLDTAIDENDRLNHLVDNLLLAAKIDKNYFREKEIISLDEEIQKASRKYVSKYPNLNLKVSGDPVPELKFNRHGMESILSNLIENGIKYSSDDPIISIHLDQEQEFIRISIADEGIGVPQKEKKKIFEQFYRVGSEETRKTKGTGLGLYIVKKILDAHNGDINVKDNEPKGTIFEIIIPKTL